MKPIRKQRLLAILSIIITLGVAAGLMLYALRQNISLFYSPTQVANLEAPTDKLIRLGGVVVKGSVQRGANDLTVRFKLTDYQNMVQVVYRGVLPDLFREGQGIVAQGQLLDHQTFKAREVLAKHDENYMPPEVRATLAQE